MNYGNTKDKQAGIEMEPVVAQRFVNYLRLKGYIVRCEKSTLYENMVEKIDFHLYFDRRTPYKGFLHVPIDTKYANSVTVIDVHQENSIENSKSLYDVVNLFNKPDNILIIELAQLRECFKKYPPILLSKKDASKFFWVENYMEEHKEEFSKEQYERIIIEE